MKKIMLKEEEVNYGSLILVNRTYPLKWDYEENGRLMKHTYLITAEGSSHNLLLESRTASMLARLWEGIDNRGTLTLNAGYKSRAWFPAGYEPTPEDLEHMTGYAFDLNLHQPEKSDPHNLADIQAFRKFKDQAPRLGFIHRYPKEKVSATGIPDNSCHFRYVGYPHSEIITQKNFVLEEYLSWIKNFSYPEYYTGNFLGQEIAVSYIPLSGASSDKITLSDNELYQVSGDNMEGCILTVWKLGYI